MKKGYLSLSGILVMFVLGACKTEPDPIVQKSDYWVILDVDTSKKGDNTLSWDFEIKKPRKYNVQVVTKTKDISQLPELKVISKEMEIQESPVKIFDLLPKKIRYMPYPWQIQRRNFQSNR